jgi:putative heme uptake system protein
MATDPRRTFVLVDGENLDATLGGSVLARRPEPEERPRWERLLSYADELWGQPATGLFFLNATAHLPNSFVSALLAIGFRPVPLSGKTTEKVVDLGIQRTLDALVEHEADVLLCSHDGDFLEHIERLVGTRKVGMVGFKEFMNAGFATAGVEVHDLEYDVKAFNITLPRVRVISLDEFDPEEFLR